MKIIILAAGKGTRLKPLTDTIPKCMVKLDGKPIIEYQLDLFEKNENFDVSIITGYLQEKVDFIGVKKFYNPNYDTTNMVNTLFCAEKLFDSSDDILISYGDIVYNEYVLNKIVESDAEVNVVADKCWKTYWQARMNNPLDDAETFKVDEEGFIKELGKQPNSYNDIEAQYIGLIKIRRDVIEKIKDYYHSLDRKKIYDGKDINNMYMTTFLQLIIDNLIKIKPVYICNGWLEVDTLADLKHSKFLLTGINQTENKIVNS